MVRTDPGNGAGTEPSRRSRAASRRLREVDCLECGAWNRVRHEYCAQCGSPLWEDDAAPRTPRSVVLNGPSIAAVISGCVAAMCMQGGFLGLAVAVVAYPVSIVLGLVGLVLAVFRYERLREVWFSVAALVVVIAATPVSLWVWNNYVRFGGPQPLW